MHGHIFDFWYWLGMALAMTAWIALLGAVVYFAAGLARGDRKRRSDL